MEHGGEAARPTTLRSAELGMAGIVPGREANIGSGAFDGLLGSAGAATGSVCSINLSAVAGRGVVPVVLVGTQFHLHHEPGHDGVAYPTDIGTASWRQLGPPVDAVLVVGTQLPGGVVPVHGNYGYYSALQPLPGPGARRGVVLVGLLPGSGGVVYSWDYTLQPRPGAGPVEVLVDPLPDGAAHGEVFASLLPGGVGAARDDHGAASWRQLFPPVHAVLVGPQIPGVFVPVRGNYGYYALQPQPGSGASRGVVLGDLLPDGAGHGEVFVGLLPGGDVAVHDNYGYYACQAHPGAGRGEVLPYGVGVVFDGSGNIARQTLPAPRTRGADGIAGAPRGPNLGDGYGNRGVVGEHLRRLLPFAGIGACSVAVNGLAASPGSPAVAFHLFALLLGGLFLVMLSVHRV